MQKFEINGPGADKLGKHLANYLGELEEAKRYPPGSDEFDCRMQYIFWDSYSGGSGATMLNSRMRLWRDAGYGATYRIAYAPMKQEIEFGSGPLKEKVIDFCSSHSTETGSAVGYSNVIPLSEEAYQAIYDVQRTSLSLDPVDLMPVNQRPHNATHLFIGAAIHLGSLPWLFEHPEGCRWPPATLEPWFFTDHQRRRGALNRCLAGIRAIDTPQLPGARAVIKGMIAQIANYLPPLTIHNDVLSYADRRKQDLPKLMCPISGLGLGAFILDHHGFLPVKELKYPTSTRVLYELDFSAYNKPASALGLDPNSRKELRRGMIRLIRAL